MAFQSNTWNWKHLAARLLLVPVLAGSTAGLASAQSFQSNWNKTGAKPATTSSSAAKAPGMKSPTTPAPTANSAPSTRSADPKDLLKQGRQALTEGRFDAAQDLALKCEQAAIARSYKWGFFEDTPASLRKDVTEARLKADKTQAADLMKKAKIAFTQKAGNDAERMQNLDLALNMAMQAKSLNPSTSVWDLGDKPADLIESIKLAQDDLRKKTGITPGAVAKNPTLPAPSIPTTATMMTPTAANKADVLRVVAEGRAMLAKDDVLGAKAKADQARKMADEKGLLKSFAQGEDTPDQLFNAAKAKGTEMVTTLMADCDKQIALGQYDRADAACAMALQLSNGFGLYSKPIDDKRQSFAKMVKPAVATTVTTTVATAAPAAPVMPKTEYLVPAPAKSQLLEQAASELKHGNYDMARTLAVRSFNTEPGAKNDAQAILRQIDGEVAAKRRSEAATALNNALAVYSGRNYTEAQSVMLRIDPALLTPENKMKLDAALADCQSKTNPVKLATATDDDLKKGLQQLGQDVKAATTPTAPPVAVAPVAPVTPPPVNPAMEAQKAAADIAFEKLRSEAIETMKVAGTAWGKGETDAAMKALDEYTAKVRASGIPIGRQEMLLKPILARTDAYGIMKHNYDFELKEAKEKAASKQKLLGDRVAEAKNQDEIKAKFAELNELNKQGKFKEAEGLALQLKLLNPDDPVVEGLYQQQKFRRRVEDNKTFQREDEAFNLHAFNEAEKKGPYVDLMDPLKVNPERTLNAMRRGEENTLRARTSRERDLEAKLSANYPMLKFENMPLRDVLHQIRDKAGVNITVDNPTLEEEKISLDSVIITEQMKDLSLDSALRIILNNARLVHIIENDVVTITTEKRTKGRMKTKAFHVMDLVTPIPEYKLSDHHTLTGAMNASKQLPPAIAQMNGIGTQSPSMSGAMNGGTLVSGNSGAGGVGANGGQLSNTMLANGPNAMTPLRVQYAEQLKKLITGLVRPYSWADNGQTTGGGGTIAYYDIGAAMVVNQTADVISEVENLLNSLRRLQDLSVSVEIRVVSLSETYFERIGVDFQANITTDNSSFERSLSTSSFRPQPFLNSMNGINGVTTGWSPATGFTSDLGVPIRPSSYALTAPPFGGYQNALSPTLNGGLSLGLAFLNDIQVYMFLEAAAGNRRINIMQAPKITLFNGQTSTVFVGDLAYFATGLQVYSANGQFIYLPVNQSFPIGQGFNPNGVGTGTSSGVSVTVQAIISADRRFVRLNLTPSLTALASATVPLYPITTFITPVFEGGSQGQPIPFTQFFQQPSFTEISAQTTVAIPDGGTVLLGGLKTLAQGRNEFGPPVLSNIPYLNRLFKNVGIGQETRHVMLMVTPRIIINSEEEARQTGDGIAGGLPPQQ